MKRQLILLWATTSGRESVLLAAAAGFLLAGAAIADAQQPTPGAAAPATGTPKPQPKKPTPPAPAPAAAPAAPAPANPQATPQAQSDAQLVYTPWTKVCGPDGPPGSNAKQVCLTVMEARLETGQMIAGAAIVEPEGDPRKILRVTVPLGMQLPQGTRVIIDQGTPAQRPYEMCLAVGCMSDYDASIDMVSKLKSGQSLIIQAINSAGQPIGLSMPLADFAKAYDGPPTDQKALEEQQKKLQEELQRRAEETRKKLESKQPPAGPGGAATPAEK